MRIFPWQKMRHLHPDSPGFCSFNISPQVSQDGFLRPGSQLRPKLYRQSAICENKTQCKTSEPCWFSSYHWFFQSARPVDRKICIGFGVSRMIPVMTSTWRDIPSHGTPARQNWHGLLGKEASHGWKHPVGFFQFPNFHGGYTNCGLYQSVVI